MTQANDIRTLIEKVKAGGMIRMQDFAEWFDSVKCGPLGFAAYANADRNSRLRPYAGGAGG